MAGKLSPMMAHYLKVKQEYSDCVVFYRLGDFYEMFFDDAIEVSRELELTLTGRDCGMDERAPMCGVPFHSADTYIARLIGAGYKVAICEQVEDPKDAKGMVAREVVRVITSGTTVSDAHLKSGENNYLVVLYKSQSGIGFVASDASTGEMMATELESDRYVIDELSGYGPKEIIANSTISTETVKMIERTMNVKCQIRDELFEKDAEFVVREQFKNTISGLKLDTMPSAVFAVAGAIEYIKYARKTDISYINKINVYKTENYMELDFATRRNLEITETMREKAKRGTLFWVLDKTKTSMGRRRLRRWIERPLLNPDDINKRLESVKELVNDAILRDEIGEILSRTYDISRIISRIALRTVTAKDLISLKQTISCLPELEYKLSGLNSQMFKGLCRNFDTLNDVFELIDAAILEDDKRSSEIYNDSDIIKAGYNEEADRLRDARNNGTSWLDQVRDEERERTGIPKLKTGYNKVFGYFIEITNSYKDKVPEDYIRKQTLTNAERYITPKLKEIESTILGATERLTALENELFGAIRDMLEGEIERIKRAAEIISVTDVLFSLATVAYRNKYCMPEVNASDVIEIKDGRHPVVEQITKDIIFVPNDTEMDSDSSRLLIITGPNMAGKSTYMRQTAIITLMAQVGSFVPASSAKIGVVDRIFTRVGASDDIASGQSTFMIEMTEVSNILSNATSKSLIILDEIGRGTSTYDGLSIAWAVAEYIHNRSNIGAKTMFATHYHEMTELENKLDGIKNYRVAVNKNGDEISFLRRIVRGGADESYGIEVAALAGVPQAVISRAKEILKSISEGDEIGYSYTPTENSLPVYDENETAEIISQLKDMDVTTMTAIDAMNTLYRLSVKAKDL